MARKPYAHSKFTDDAEATLCEIIAEGGTVSQAAEALKVHPSTIWRWLRDEDRAELRDKYTRSREDQGDWFADKIIEIALDPNREANDITARVNALKWLAGKRKPKVYGDKIQTEMSGSITLTHEDALAQLK